VVVGVPNDDANARGINSTPIDQSLTNSGAAYVYVRDGSGALIQDAYLKASNADAGDSFGWSVDIDGDVIVVGAPGESSSATGSRW
jgi:hypothetical protein